MVSVDKSRVMVAAATGKTLRHKVQSKQMDSSIVTETTGRFAINHVAGILFISIPTRQAN